MIFVNVPGIICVLLPFVIVFSFINNNLTHSYMSNNNNNNNNWIPLSRPYITSGFEPIIRTTRERPDGGSSLTKRWTLITTKDSVVDDFQNANNNNNNNNFPVNNNFADRDDSSYFPQNNGHYQPASTSDCCRSGSRNRLTVYLERGKCSHTFNLKRELNLRVKTHHYRRKHHYYPQEDNEPYYHQYYPYNDVNLPGICVLLLYTVIDRNNLAISFTANERSYATYDYSHSHHHQSHDLTSSRSSSYDIRDVLRNVKLYSVVSGVVNPINYTYALEPYGPSLILSNGSSVLMTVVTDGLVDFIVDIYTYSTVAFLSNITMIP